MALIVLPGYHYVSGTGASGPTNAAPNVQTSSPFAKGASGPVAVTITAKDSLPSNAAAMGYLANGKEIPAGTPIATVPVGAAIRFTLTLTNGKFGTGDIPVGESMTFTANTPGTYPFHCNWHGDMMTGTIVVTPK